MRVKITESDIDKSLRLGIFKNPGQEFDAIIRLSNGSGDPGVSDKAGGGQGFALKIFLPDVLKQQVHVTPAEKWFEDKKYYLTQDILGINRVSEFFVENVDEYFALFEAQGAVAAAVTEAVKAGKSPEEIEKLGQEVFAQKFVFDKAAKEPRVRQATVLGKLRQVKTKDPLIETYHSMVPSRLGSQAVKYALRPCQALDVDKFELPADIDPEKDRNFNRTMAKRHLAAGSTCYKVSVVVHKEGFPEIERPASPWPVSLETDYVDVAEIQIPHKKVGEELANEELCETVSFTPWHSLPEHLPVGAVQRTREAVYAAVAVQRNLNAGRKELPKTP